MALLIRYSSWSRMCSKSQNSCHINESNIKLLSLSSALSPLTSKVTFGSYFCKWYKYVLLRRVKLLLTSVYSLPATVCMALCVPIPQICPAASLHPVHCLGSRRSDLNVKSAHGQQTLCFFLCVVYFFFMCKWHNDTVMNGEGLRVSLWYVYVLLCLHCECKL
jgi:hypothetical protein